MVEPRGPEGGADALTSRDDVLGGLPALRHPEHAWSRAIERRADQVAAAR